MTYIHLPLAGEALRHCEKRLPQFRWEIQSDNVDKISIMGSFEGRVLNLFVFVVIRPELANAWLTQRNPSQQVLAQSAELSYQKALADVMITLSEFVQESQSIEVL